MYDLGLQFHIDSNKLKSKKDAMVTGNNYRFTILTERLIRLEYNKNSIFNDASTQLVVFRDFELPTFDVKQDENFLEISTSYFTLFYAKNTPFKGTTLNAMKNLKVSLNDTDNVWYYGHPEVRNYFGSNISIEDTNKEKPYNKGLYSLEGFVSIDDSNTLRLDENGTIYAKMDDAIDMYLFMYNKDFGLCLQDYFKLTGNPSMIPRYVLGNWWCKDRAYSEAEILEVVNNFQRNNIPISVFLLDKKWHSDNARNGEIVKTGFTFNPQIFKNPKETITQLHINGIRVGLNIDPSGGIYPSEQFFSEAIKYLQPDENGIIKFAPLNPKYLDVYFKMLIHPLETYGVDFFWNDYNNIKDLRTLWVMNHYHYLDLARNPAKRGMILSRNPLVASHRYPVLYSGETKTSWDNFKKLPFFNISSSNIGVCWWSHDVAGYCSGVEESELYIRSVQLGVFSPILRFHSMDGKFYKKEPWKWNLKTNKIVASYLSLRHRLTSYLYSEAYRYHKSGKIIFQPLYYLFPQLYDDTLYRNEYFFGSELLVAPIINKSEPIMNRTIHRFYLPEGIWYDYTTGKKFPGNTKYTSFFKDEDYPVFAKQGSIIPLSNKSNINNTSNPEDLEIQIFPGKNNTYELYEDDGISSLYKEGFYILTSIDYNYLPNNYTVIVRSIEGKSGIIPDYRNYKFRFRNTKKADDVIVYFDNQKIESKNYVEDNDFIVEVLNVKTVGQLTVNCKGQNIEIDAVRLVNEDIASILMDLQIETELKEKIDKVLFGDEPINKKRISLRKLKKDGLDKSFIKLFLKLLEYVSKI